MLSKNKVVLSGPDAEPIPITPLDYSLGSRVTDSNDQNTDSLPLAEERQHFELLDEILIPDITAEYNQWKDVLQKSNFETPSQTGPFQPDYPLICTGALELMMPRLVEMTYKTINALKRAKTALKMCEGVMADETQLARFVRQRMLEQIDEALSQCSFKDQFRFVTHDRLPQLLIQPSDPLSDGATVKLENVERHYLVETRNQVIDIVNGLSEMLATWHRNRVHLVNNLAKRDPVAYH